MALNLQTFKTRTLTAIVFALVMLCGLLINFCSFFLLFSVIHFGCWFEYQKLANKIQPAYQNISKTHKYFIMLTGWGFMLWMVNNALTIANITLKQIGLFVMICSFSVVIISEIVSTKKAGFTSFFISAVGLLYISFSCGCMIDLRSEGMVFGSFFGNDVGLILPLLLIASMWINDTMAYIVGSLIGKTQLSSISPKKTWEGTIGGLVLAVATITIVGYFSLNADVLQLITISTIACIAGIFGDLLESKLKRMAGVKDSGNIMPGHGGFLDRFDSLLLATIFVWIYIKLFM